MSPRGEPRRKAKYLFAEPTVSSKILGWRSTNGTAGALASENN